jgi:hypothetical protein
MDLQRFRIYTDTDAAGPHAPGDVYTAHDLTILPADRMRAERASTTELPPSQRGANAAKANSNTYVLLWLWCAATRAQLTTEGFQAWADTVLDFDPLDRDGNVKAKPSDDDDELEAAETVDPTQPGVPTSGP